MQYVTRFEDAGNSEPVLADGEEATLKACGVGVAMLPGYSWTPTWPNGAQ